MNLSKSKVLIVGSGGREHALAWSISQSNLVETVYVAPGNVGCTWASHSFDGREFCECKRIPIPQLDFEKLLIFSKSNKISFVMVGDALPLSLGIVDFFTKNGINIFGPTAAASQIESSKQYAKKVMYKANIPTASSKIFNNYDDAFQYGKLIDKTIVVKSDIISGGKGVFICNTDEEYINAIQIIFKENRYNAVTPLAIVEEYLVGVEFSFFAFVNKNKIIPFCAAHDYKKAFSGNIGLNTAGVGAIAPFKLDNDEIKYIEYNIIKPLLIQLEYEGISYNGLIYAGLIKTVTGIKVLEFNCRFGDPETQAMLPLLNSDLFVALSENLSHSNTVRIDWADKKCSAIVVSTSSYPNPSIKGIPISLKSQPKNGTVLFHSNTEILNGALVTSSGRIFTVSSISDDFETSSKMSLKYIKENIVFDGMYCRNDIGIIYSSPIPQNFNKK